MTPRPLVLALLATLVLPAAATARVQKVRAPHVSGAPVVGRTLSASHGTWRGRPTRFSYAWLSCDSRGRRCRTVKGAHWRRHKVKAQEAGHRLRAKVTARRGRGRAASARSAPTAVVRSAAAAAPPQVQASGLHVAGNKLLDAAGNAVQLHGVNRSGTEYACIQGDGIFDGPSDDASLAAIRSWNSNAVRIPLNEDCWLGVNGVASSMGGAAYRDAIVAYARRIEAHGMYPELSLMWGAPGSNKATYQSGAPDADHSPDMWRSLAETFKDDHSVLLAPWGETIVNADCFLHGGTCEATFNSGSGDRAYPTAGMQQAVDVMRGAGYGGPIVIPGIDYANDLSQWLSHKPSDPLGQLVAEAHIYGKNVCGTTACMDRQYAPVAAQVPLILGETGETYDDSSCGSTNITAFMNWADAHDVGYETWTWDTWGTCGSLISSYDGTPANEYGRAVKAHYATRP